jgi:molybdenum cofactor cytidylyltransferase
MIPAIVLAAGQSSRMGRSKPNLPVGAGPAIAHETLLTHLVRTLLDAGTDDVVIVVGHEKEAVMRTFAASGLPARFVENAEYASGQLSSLLAGLRHVDRPGVVATLIALVDVPFVSRETIQAVVERYLQTGAQIVRPTRDGHHGHPVLVARSLFDQLRRADSVLGAKPVVRAHATPQGEVMVEDEGAFFDIDTPDDYERAIRAFAGGRSLRSDTGLA